MSVTSGCSQTSIEQLGCRLGLDADKTWSVTRLTQIIAPAKSLDNESSKYSEVSDQFTRELAPDKP
jgi:hypothetical protein